MNSVIGNSKHPNRPGIARNNLVGCQKRDSFNLSLRDQNPVEGVPVDRRDNTACGRSPIPGLG